MRSDGAAPVAIVGGGFSGTILAAQLAKRGIDSVLIEGSGRAGQGTAFSTQDPVHLLNVPAETMGAWQGAPEDFVTCEHVEPASYAERRQFGRYLRTILQQAVASGHTKVVDGLAVGAMRSGTHWRLDLREGGSIDAEMLVLATGNQPPGSVAGLEALNGRLIADPWSDAARNAIQEAAAAKSDILILGASLTMVDVALSLTAAGHQGSIVALSRRGKIPLSQGTDDPAPVEWEALPPPRVRDIAKWIRRRSREVGWRPAVDSLRPHSQRLWQAMPLQEKRLFLRYGRPWWDIHRHRVAPEVGRKIDDLIDEGRLEVLAGELVRAQVRDGAIEVSIRKRGNETPEVPRQFGCIFNCTGPLHAIEKTRDRLLRSILDAREAVPDQLGIGFEADEKSRVGERLWALGSLTKARYWEIIAVPDIREQAASVADDIVRELQS